MTRVFIAIALACSGCSGGGDGGDPSGGYVRLEHRVTEGAEATFGRAELTDAKQTRPAKESCTFAAQPDPGDEWIDAGPSITLVRDGGGDAIELTRASIGSLVVYGADGLLPSLSPAGARFDVLISGSGAVAAQSWDAGIEIPEPFTAGDFTNEIGFATDQAFTWTPSGADEVVVEVTGSGQPSVVCRSKDDGEVLVKQSLNEQINSAGGTVVIRSIRRSTETLGGRTVSLEGQYVIQRLYE